jgi:hypothetical protein
MKTRPKLRRSDLSVEAVKAERSLATVLFSGIVGSTERGAAMGDNA